MLVINNNLHFSLYNNMMLYTIYFIFLILQNCLAYFLAVQYGQKVFFIVFHTIMNIHTIFQRIIPFRMFFFYPTSWWPFSYGASSGSSEQKQAIREMEICCYEGFRQRPLPLLSLYDTLAVQLTSYKTDSDFEAGSNLVELCVCLPSFCLRNCENMVIEFKNQNPSYSKNAKLYCKVLTHVHVALF